MNLALVAVAGAGLFGSCAPACLDRAIGEPASSDRPVCIPNIEDVDGTDYFGPGVVQVKWENDLGCDLVAGQSLTLVIDERSWESHTGSADGWGGDASMAWATVELEDAGCRVVWHGGEWVEGQECDF